MSPPQNVVEELRRNFDSGTTRNLQWRKENLLCLVTALRDRSKDINDAARLDFGKPSYEVLLTEIEIIKSEAHFALKNLDLWTRPKAAKMDLLNSSNRGYTLAEPKGVVLVISCWNYPFSLSFLPLINAIAAGNCVVLKPSEVAPRCSREIRTIVNQYLDRECIQVVEGNATVTNEVLRQPFDHIIFTGSAENAKVVLKAAAEHLTPVTLELAGKNPAYVDVHPSRIAATARRLVWGRFVNGGQTCTSPDYILVRADLHTKLLRELCVAITDYYGEDPLLSSDLCSIVDECNFNRLLALMEADKQRVVFGGDSDPISRQIAPTILDNIHETDHCMKEEVYGPLMLIRSVRDVAEACEVINRVNNRPLVMYVFTEDKNVKGEMLNKIISGGVCVNDTLLHGSMMTLPFGGVGRSGMGSYHGYEGFRTFSHMRSCLEVPFWTEFIGATFRYGPYRPDTERNLMKMFEREQTWSWMPESFRLFVLTVCALPGVRRRKQ